MVRPSKAKLRNEAHLRALEKAANVATLQARVAELELALQPFAEFGEYIEKHPRRGLDNELYGWDAGKGAILRQSDLRYAALVYAKGTP